jgi:hypothetical protein
MGAYIYYTINSGKPEETSTVRLNITDFDTATAADLGQLILDFAPVVKALVDGGLERAGFGFDVPVPALTWSAVAAAASDVQEKAYFGFRTAANKASHFTIPTFKEAKMVAGSKLVNTADTAVAALITAMEDGFTSGGALFRFGDSNDSNFDILKVAREAWGAYRK